MKHKAHLQEQHGFTLIELLIVLAVLGILAMIVALNMLGFWGKGQDESYAADERSIQSIVSTFYADVHQHDVGGLGWNEAGGSPTIHNYPTRDGRDSALFAGDALIVNGESVREVWNAPGSQATDQQILDAAIWMGLLVNTPGTGPTGAPDIPPGDANSPLGNEKGPYLNEIPQSCSILNHSLASGSYVWIIGRYGKVHGVFQEDDVWYAGFSGEYP